MIGAALFSGAVALAAASQPPCPHHVCGASSLAPYFAALKAAGAGQGGRVHILQIGDSHSAADAISGAGRAALQARFGDGGRGVLPPGRPFAGFTPHGVTVAQSDGWTVQSLLGAAALPDDVRPRFGLSGFRATALAADARIAVTADAGSTVDEAVVCAEHGPGAGALRLTLGAASAEVDLAADATAIACTRLRSDTPEREVGITSLAGPVVITSLALFKTSGGLVLSNLGVVGAQLRHFARTDDAAVAEELAAYRPDLIILAYGTNEGFSRGFDAEAYAALLEGQIARLRRLSGGTPILVLGAPDAEAGRRTEPPAPRRRRGRKPPPPRTVVLWASPPGLAEVRAVQKRVARTQGVAFWDWAARMGAPGAAGRWEAASPPLMRPDHVHFTRVGGVEIARKLAADLDAAAAALAGEH